MNKKIDIIKLQKIYDPRGTLVVAEENTHVPFEIGNTEWFSPKSTVITQHQRETMLVALAGHFTLRVIEHYGRLSVSADRFHRRNRSIATDGSRKGNQVSRPESHQ